MPPGGGQRGGQPAGQHGGLLHGVTPNGFVQRLARGLGAGVWLVYLALPLRSLPGHHDAMYLTGAIAFVVVFAALYMALIVIRVPNRSPRHVVDPVFVVLFAIALAASIIYGEGGITMWIFVASATGWTVSDRRVAARVLVVVLAVYVILARTSHLGATDFFTILLPTALVGVAVIGFRRRMELTQQLTRAREEIEQMAAAQERLRLARDMHDLTGQSLSTITLKSELAARLLSRLPESANESGERDRAREEIEQVAAISRQTLRDIRQAISGYRRPTLAVEAITARSALESAGIAPHDDAELTLASGTFDPDVEAALAWCLREAVTNVVRHSGAANCHIGLTCRSRSVSLTVRDDGHGSALGTGGAGLRGMSERLAAVGGHLELRPSSGGFGLIATVPIATVPAGDRVTVTT
jgi:two-component system, NarL family, sensor histidine kinase DesK